MTDFSIAELDGFAEILRREKTPEARRALAVAALLSLEPADKAALMNWCALYEPGILRGRAAA